jgi:hypothetical protein
MSNKPLTDPWTLIPPYWQVEVPRLLNSKDDFLGPKKRSSAGATELATLYGELEAAWDELTLRPSNSMLELLRKRARRLQQDLKLIEQDLNRDETSVTKDLERQYERELHNDEQRLQHKRGKLQTRRKILLEQRASWPSELAELRQSYATSLRTLRTESNERITQLKTDLEMEWKRFETNEAGDEVSLADLAEQQQQLQMLQLSLDQKRKNLSDRKASLPLQQEQIDADLTMQRENSEKSNRLRKELKSKQQDYAELKAKLLSLGLIKEEDFSDTL